MKLFKFLNKYFSLSGLPEEIKVGDVAVIVTVTILVVLVLPAEGLIRLAFLDYLWVFILSFLVSLFIVFVKGIIDFNHYYIRSLWALIGGVTWVIVAFIFRVDALGLGFAFLSFGSGQVYGFLVCKKIL